MKYSGEIKAGITGLITIVVIIWGINYLKGRNIFSGKYTLYARYTHVDGLEPSANVLLEGYKIGTVDEVFFDMDKEVPFTVSFEIEKKYRIRKGSTAEIFSADLLGTKAVRILEAERTGIVESGDTLKSMRSEDMLSGILNDVSPLLASLNRTVIRLDSTGAEINSILRDPRVDAMIDDLGSASGSLKKQLTPGGDLGKSLASLEEITGNLEKQNESVRTIITNLASLSDKLDDAGLDSLIRHLDVVSKDLALITTSVGKGEGTAGKLIFQDSLFNEITNLVTDLDSLVTDVKNNPKKYINVSLIGR